MSVHHPRRCVGQALRARSRLELGHHLRRPVGRQHRGTQPCGGQSQTTRTRGDVEELLAGSQSDQAKCRGRERLLARRDVFGVPGSDRVPRLERRELRMLGGGGLVVDAHVSRPFGDLVDLLGDQTVCLAMHVSRDVRGGRVDETEDLARRLVHPVAQVVDAMRPLGAQVGVVGLRHVVEGDGIVQRVDVEEQWHLLVLPGSWLRPTL